MADAARFLTRFDDVRAVVCDAVQRKTCTVAGLTAELQAGPSAGSALLREALAEVSDGVRSVSEADFRVLIVRSNLPKPVFNAQLFDANGKSRGHAREALFSGTEMKLREQRSVFERGVDHALAEIGDGLRDDAHALLVFG